MKHLPLSLISSRRTLTHVFAAAVAGLLILTGTAAQSQPYAYVTQSGAASVSVIDTATNLVAGTIAVGVNPTRVAFNPAGTRAYVSNTGSDSVSVIDTATRSVLANIAVGDGPGYLAVTPNGERVYVALAGGLVGVLDTASNTLMTTVTVGTPGLGGTGGLAVTPDGSRVYVASGYVSVIETASNTVIANIIAGNAPIDVAITPDGTRAYVTNAFGLGEFSFDGQVVEVNIATNSVSDVIGFWSVPGSIAISPDGTHAYVAAVARWVDTGYGAAFIPDRWVGVIDLTTNTLTNFVLMTKTAAGIGVTQDGSRVYVAIRLSNTVQVIDTATNAVTAAVAVPGTPTGLGILITPPPVLLGLTVSPSSVAGGKTSTGTVTLDRWAPTGGTTVNLSSKSLYVSIPATVVVPAGALSTTFTIGTIPVTSQTTANIRATLNGTLVKAPLTIKRAVPKSVTLAPARLVGGAASTGTVTLTGPAPAGGILVALSSSHGAASVAPSVLVPAGDLSASFSIATIPVAVLTKPIIKATANGISKTVVLKIDP